MIAVEKLVKSYNANRVLHGVDHSQQTGEAVVLIGPSGCGKSTFLRCLNQLEIPDSGRVTIGGVTIEGGCAPRTRAEREQQRRLRLQAGMVFQAFNLFPHLTVLRNITEAPMVVKGVARQKPRRWRARCWPRSDWTTRPPRIRRAFGRPAATGRHRARPGDEPASHALRRTDQRAGPGIARRSAAGHATIGRGRDDDDRVTHEMQFARDMADSVLFFDNGRVAESGPPEQIFSDAKQERTREFLRRVTTR